MDELIAQVLVYIKGTWKYRWVSIAIAWLVSMIGWTVVHQLPDDYEASARIHVDTQNILRPLMAGMTVSPNPEQQVAIMSRTLISRPNVERVIRMVDLDVKVTDDIAYDKLVTSLMKDIKLGAAGRENLFTISYSHKDPKLAKDIVQSLLTIFVEGGLENKKQDSTSALRFLDQQIASYEEKLIASETALTAFRQKNIGLMPGQSGDYYAQLTNALEELEKAKVALKEAERARDAVRRQVSGDETVLLLETHENVLERVINPEIDARIQALNLNLDNLRLNFTDLHPDIVATKRLIAQLEERKKEEAALIDPTAIDQGRNFSPMLQQLNIALTEAEAVVASMQARVSEYTNRYERLKSMSSMIPTVEAELTQLSRDYSVNKANYEKLLERRASAEISGELTSTTGLMSFRIIDPPVVPEVPSGPDRRKLYSFVFIGALLAGIGVAFIISQIRPTFHSQTDLRQVTGLAILGTIPMVWTDQEKSKRRNRLYVFGLSLLVLMALYTTLMIYTKLPVTTLIKLF